MRLYWEQCNLHEWHMHGRDVGKIRNGVDGLTTSHINTRVNSQPDLYKCGSRSINRRPSFPPSLTIVMPVGFTEQDAPSKPVEKLLVTRGLEGQDDNIDLLESYFREMQKATVETLSPDDLLSFATCAHYFAVISVETTATPASDEGGEEDAEGEPEDASEAVSESAYPASSRPSSPPTSSVTSNFSIISPSEDEELSEDEIYSRYAALSEQDKVLKWREAFLDKLEDDDFEPIVPPTKPEDFDDEESMHDDQDTISTDPETQMDENTANYINWPEDTLLDEQPVYQSSSVEPLTGLQFYKPIEPVLVDKEFGREYLEPEQYDTPVPPPPEIPTIPEMDTFIYEQAVQYRDRLRALRVAEYERKQARRARQAARPPTSPGSLPNIGSTPCNKPIGLIYLWTPQTFNDPLHMGECNLGFYFVPEYRKKEYLAEALNKAVEEAFEDKQCHRLQSIVVENDEKLYTLQLLSASGFRHEGTRRLRLRTTSLWDEILTRHQRELDELHRLEEKTLKRSTSTETIRQRAYEAAPLVVDCTDSETQSTAGTDRSVPSIASNTKRRRISSENVRPGEMQPRLRPQHAPGGDREIPRAAVPPPTFVRTNQPIVGPSTRRRRTGGLSFKTSSSASSRTSGSAEWVVLDN
ncbi:hypothetical protein CPB84DRAFT_1115184 [Gymnopilus junonius]|uniref:Uncharacterized protein n=1 Tax=Gymnopilus junonius TaxID=109634 RepID=A0A9P5TLT4_GYMJU|nr:hypothetical protein CPB84DRAFT_1115184 [Gymnopilus junonius]